MNNWEITRKHITNHGILPVDDVPSNVIDYLKNNITNKKANENLAGHIKQEYHYENWPDYISKFILKNILHDYFYRYRSGLNILSSDKPFYIKRLWVNLQKKYEFNPIHDHTGLFSFIIFLKIPYDLKDEDKIFPNVNGKKSTSRLCFLVNNNFSDAIGVRDLLVDVDKSFEGKMLMFPSKLQHLVYPFYTSDDYRITVSGNVNFWVD
jgi:hypothetical protein